MGPVLSVVVPVMVLRLAVLMPFTVPMTLMSTTGEPSVPLLPLLLLALLPPLPAMPSAPSAPSAPRPGGRKLKKPELLAATGAAGVAAARGVESMTVEDPAKSLPVVGTEEPSGFPPTIVVITEFTSNGPALCMTSVPNTSPSWKEMTKSGSSMLLTAPSGTTILRPFLRVATMSVSTIWRRTTSVRATPIRTTCRAFPCI